MPERNELVELIESGKHVLIGAKALAHYTKPRFTEDTDYLVSGQTFVRIRKWAKDHQAEHDNLGAALRFPGFALDVLDARSNEVLKEILNHERAIPSPEALAAAKYVSMINIERAQRRLQDVSDFAQLVMLEVFDAEKLRTFLVAPYADQWPQVQKLIEDIKAGRPITI
ncbi:MAG: hypothetical protein H6817_03745 [Phycisphaerales bacterium]|nr:hypothetical protein [Phycisphaerales bacterium]